VRPKPVEEAGNGPKTARIGVEKPKAMPTLLLMTSNLEKTPGSCGCPSGFAALRSAKSSSLETITASFCTA